MISRHLMLKNKVVINNKLIKPQFKMIYIILENVSDLLHFTTDSR